MIGKTISHYEIIEKLGEGGMGIVYKARDPKLDRCVAIKFLSASHAATEQDKTRFIHEARAASALEHPHICTIHEINETPDGQLFLVMPCYEGTPLSEKIEQGLLPVNEAIDIAIQIADGLQAAHEKRIVHRDIKSSNIFITSKGQVKVMDFGLARSAGMTKVTKTGMTVGTIPYMSPEQVRGEEFDHRTDIWSFGVVFYEMLTGEQPFKGSYEHAIVYSILNEEPRSILELRKELAPEAVHAAKKMLQKQPENRYQTMEEVLTELRSLRSNIKKTKTNIEAKGTVPSIAVLPFADMSPGKDQEYFAEGIAEELLNALAHIHDLRVVARTSAFAIKGMNLDIREIGRRLNVKSVLEGSVRKAGNRLRVTAQLINVEDGFHLWSDRYDRDMADIFAIQDEITAAIVDSLKVTLKVGEKTALRKRSTENLEAYNLYLQGVHFWNKRTPEGVKISMMRFREAIEKDPGFALAYAGLANSYNIIGILGPLSPREAYHQARDLALKALELDEDLAEAHTALGTALGSHYWDWAGAERAFKQAIELNPGSSNTRHFYGLFLIFVGRFDEAIQELRKAQELDPVTAPITWNLGVAFTFARQYDRGIQECKKAMELDPAAYQPYLHVALPYSMKGMHEEAIAAAQKVLELLGEESSPWKILLALAHAEAGNQDEARRILAEVIALSEKRHVSPAYIAGVYVGLNERDKAFEWLYRAYEEHDPWFIAIAHRPSLDNFREDPRAKALFRGIGLE